MNDDLVKRLRNVQFWQADCNVRMQAAARIEELEDARDAANAARDAKLKYQEEKENDQQND